MGDFTPTIDRTIENAMQWVIFNAGWPFDILRLIFNGFFRFVEMILIWPPFWLFLLAFTLLGLWLIGRFFALFVLIGFWLCFAMGLWRETMSTLALVLTATSVALLVAIPLGIIVGLSATLSRFSNGVLDFIQTMPPYIYLLPGIALLGYGPATAVAATVVVAIPPALRLSAHGIRMTPVQYRELGTATGMTPFKALWLIRLPYALPSILAGINQSIMLGFGMVVIAGIAGSGGLGQSVYESVRTLSIGRSFEAGLAIVILSIFLDRLSQRLGALQKLEER